MAKDFLARLPFEAMVKAVLDDLGTYLEIVSVDLNMDYGMTPDLANKINKYGKCNDCGRKPIPFEVHAQCSKWRFVEERTRGRSVQHLKSRIECFDHSLHKDIICGIILKSGKDEVIKALHDESPQRNSFLRQARLKAAGPMATMREKAALFELQEQHCYYCYRLIARIDDWPDMVELSPDIRLRFEANFDHYQAVSRGGTNQIYNLVAACGQCNHDKANMHGDQYKAIVLERLKKNSKKRSEVKKLQRRVDKWRSEQSAVLNNNHDKMAYGGLSKPMRKSTR